ncbi:MAG: NAD(P)H dehydrogenase [Lachnospiraceae bacterium]|nr:NAD(P)H dehydrogenase [Lachnospiraceae bacterium]
MKILVINGSPKGKRSNTYRLTESFLEGIKQGALGTEEISVEEIQVSGLDLKPCLGCFSCWNKTPGQCCIHDDMQQVIQKLLWADVTIWSFPLYYYTVPGGLKNLIDRQLPMNLPFMTEREDGVGSGSHPARYDMSGKRTVLISTCGFYSAEGNYDGVRSLFDHMCGKDRYTAIFCGQGELFRVPEMSWRTDEYLSCVREAGREYAQSGGIAGEIREKLDQLLMPKVTFEEMADASWGINRESGEREKEALIFTRQMAALYRREAYSGRDLVLEMYYTDLGERYQILLGKEGSRVLTDLAEKADTTIETPYTVWQSIAAGEIRGDEALMKQMYKVKGDFGLMINWDRYFDGAGGRPDGRNGKGQAGTGAGWDTGYGGIHVPRKETNMNILLIPWIVFWVAAAIDGYMGSLISIGVCALVPLVFYRHQKTVYDVVSGVCVTGLSVGVLAGVPVRTAVPLAYLIFGIMWTASCCRKIPLTAHYSMYAYGGEGALENPLFIRTNRILTLMWGILYLFTPVWTWYIMGTGIGSLTGLVNSVLPAFMGIFTAWFQKWYPARVARG